MEEYWDFFVILNCFLVKNFRELFMVFLLCLEFIVNIY